MKKTTLSCNGTSYHGVDITTSVRKLTQLIGEPSSEQNDGRDKVNFNWTCTTDSGNIVTVYDWKEYRPIDRDELIDFHIGGYSLSDTLDAQREWCRLCEVI